MTVARELKVEVEPAEAGLDASRLERMGRHFRRYVDDGRLPGWLMTVARDGKLAYVASYGFRDIEAGLRAEPDTLWRFYSMTKPVTSVAAMTLYEEGALELTDPVAKFIPSFADLRVFTGGSDLRPVTVPATEPVRVWHLMTHTSGLTYGFHRSHPVDAMYRARGFEWSVPRKMTLAECCDAWATLPLLFQPGSEWNYSVATDVLGRVIEVVSGQDLDQFLRERVLMPLGMEETAFGVPEEDRPRLAALYTRGPEGTAIRLDALAHVSRSRPDYLSGGAGLIGTAADYHRFTSMLAGTASCPPGELDGVRLLSPTTVAYMTRNHLPGDGDLETFGRPLFAEAPLRGAGFGLGFAVVIDPAAGKTVTGMGEFSWGGAASTVFFADPALRLTVNFFTQLMPSSTYPIRSQLRQLAYQAVVG